MNGKIQEQSADYNLADLKPFLEKTSDNHTLLGSLPVWLSAQTTKSAGRGRSAENTHQYGVQNLRELILELAVRGKLVPQDPSDEPASVLLEKIAEEKALLVKEGRIKKTKPLPQIKPDDDSFSELPSGWERVRFGNIIQIIRGITFPAQEKSKTPKTGKVACLRTSNVQENIEWDDMLYIDEKFVSRTEQFIQKNDIIMSMANSRELVGKIALVNSEPDSPITFGGFIAALRAFQTHPLYLKAVLRTPQIKNEMIGNASQTTNIANISIGKLNLMIVPVPPLDEQHRIVKKVDELMALCDQLEQQQTDAVQAHDTLVKVLLDSLTQSNNAEDFQQNWRRIAEYFDTLFTTESSIDQLKQTLLQLAVMGKLVPQDPNDEPANTLLEKIAKEKALLVQEGKIRKAKAHASLYFEEIESLPNGWAHSQLSMLGCFAGGKTPSKSKSTYWDGDIPWVTPKDMKSSVVNGSIDYVTNLAVDDGLELFEANTLLLVVRSGILRRTFPVAITNVACTVNQDLKALKPYEGVFSEYVLLMMNGFERFILEKLTKTGTTVESMKFEEFSRTAFPLPPVAEQHRIVKKVDELMALCDQLKDRLNQAQTLQQQLADAVVETTITKD